VTEAAHRPSPAARVRAQHDLRGVIRIPAFRKLWTALSLSSFGDWLGLLALTAFARQLADDGYTAPNVAIATVFILRLAPAIVLGPLAGVVADRLDRRATMVVCDLGRFALFLSIPLVHTLWWLFVATFLIEALSLFWIPAKEASVPNLVPRERLEAANQLSLFTTYGSAPVAAAVFSGLALLGGVLDNAVPEIDEVYLALFFNAATFLVSALTILQLKEIPPRLPRLGSDEASLGVWRTLVEGWRFAGTTPLVRGLVAGMLGAFAAGGAVIGLARTFVGDLGGGEPGYGLLFGTVFCGLALGMFLGPRLLPRFSRRRLLGLSISAAGLSLAVLALIPHMVAAVLITLMIGAWAGVAWVTGYTLIGLEVADELRGRTFALLQTMVRIVLVVVLAAAPLLAAAFGRHQIEVTEAMTLTYNGAAITMLVFGLLAAGLGFASYRTMDDRPGVGLRSDLAAAYRQGSIGAVRKENAPGFFVALEGGEGAGKSTQAKLLAEWLEARGHSVLLTHEPGGTEVGRRLRTVLLDGSGSRVMSARTEALLFAADRAEHVAAVIEPALAAGRLVVTDRYTDSSLAYQGAGRDLDRDDVSWLSKWATQGLRPDITVVLDIDPEEGLRRAGASDRLESEPPAFHSRVREHFLHLAQRGGAGYLIVDSSAGPHQVAANLKELLAPRLPQSPAELAAIEAARRAEEERLRAEEERARAEAEERARLEREAAEERARLERQAAEDRARQERAAAEEAARRRQAEAEERARLEREAAQQRARLELEAAEEAARREQAEVAERARLEREGVAHRARQEQERRAAKAARRLAEQQRRRSAPVDRAGFGQPNAEGREPPRVAAGAPPPQVPAPASPPSAPAPARPDAGVQRAPIATSTPSAKDGGGKPSAEHDDAQPPTRTLSLVDELFGPPDDEDTDTVQLPRVRDDR
jgi:dTMP kinase